MLNKNTLNIAQREAVDTLTGPLLILAGAGSGKTKCLIYRLANLIDSGVNVDNILLLTFTNKAANEMLERAKNLGTENTNCVLASTFHGFAFRILKQYSSYIDIESNFNIIDSIDSKELIKIIKEKEKIVTELESSLFLSIFSYARNTMQTIEEVILSLYPKLYHVLDIFEDMFEFYTQYKKDKNVLDYDDLLEQVYYLLRDNKSVRDKLSNEYQYIMIDEYQDTNILQLKLVLYLCEKHKNICVVGDECQSIYSWRGSNFKNIMNFPKYFTGTKIVKLETNYRSTQQILNTANALTNTMVEKFDKTLISHGVMGNEPMVIDCETVFDEVKFIESSLNMMSLKQVQLNEMAILARQSYSLNLIELNFIRNKIPYKKYGGMKFLEKAHVRDFLAIFKLLHNNLDDLSWMRILTLFPGLGRGTAVKIIDRIVLEGLDVLIDSVYCKKKFFPSLQQLYVLLDELKSDTFLGQINLICCYLNNIYPFIKQYADNFNSRIAELKVFEELTSVYKNSYKFINELALNGFEQNSDSEAIVLSTIHSAKGLEWRTVYLLDCNDIYFYDKDSDNEENKRLLYVAITRAKENLFIFSPRTITLGNKSISTSFSKLLNINSILNTLNYKKV